MTQQELYALHASSMASLERWWKVKSIDSDIKDAIAEEAQARATGNGAKANRVKSKLETLREKERYMLTHLTS